MTTVVIDYGSGNLRSAAKALAAAGAAVRVSADARDLEGADRIVLPGVGAFADCRAGLAGLPGMIEWLDRVVREGGRPFLGICVGMQLMAERGLEHEVTAGFGWIDGEISVMQPPGLRLPQMGWNALQFEPGAHKLLDGLEPGDHTYFVHSYALRGGSDDELLATTDYGGAIPAIVAAGNRAGTQFHVEKSQAVGLRILANFLRWSPG